MSTIYRINVSDPKEPALFNMVFFKKLFYAQFIGYRPRFDAMDLEHNSDKTQCFSSVYLLGCDNVEETTDSSSCVILLYISVSFSRNKFQYGEGKKV